MIEVYLIGLLITFFTAFTSAAIYNPDDLTAIQITAVVIFWPVTLLSLIGFLYTTSLINLIGNK